LHYAPDSFYFSQDNAHGFVYVPDIKELLPFYKEVVSKGALRVLVYNGDTDPSLNSFRGQNWTAGLGFQETQPWRAWTVDGKQAMAGYVTRYENNFDYLTIRGSGHMVPEYKPKVLSKHDEQRNNFHSSFLLFVSGRSRIFLSLDPQRRLPQVCQTVIMKQN